MTYVDWQPYPQEKPKSIDLYFVTTDDLDVRIALYAPDPFDVENDWRFVGAVIAFAEINRPEPYRPEVNND